MPRSKYYWHKEPGPGGQIVMSKTAANEILGPFMKDPEFVTELKKHIESGSIRVIPDA